MSDSSTTIAYVNNKGSIKSKNVMKLQKKYDYGVIKITLSFGGTHTMKAQYWRRQIF